MMYLFNNVYLVPDKTTPVRPGDDYGFLSGRLTDSSFHADNFFCRVYDVVHNDPTFSAPTIEALIAERFDGEEDKFVELLTTPRDNRLLIICDEANMLKLAIRTFKTLLSNASADEGVEVIKYAYLPYFYIHDSGMLSHLGPRDFQTLYNNVVSNEDGIRKSWSRAKVWSMTPRQRERMQRTAGVELQTATYLNNPAWKFSAEYKAKIVTFAKKALVQMLVGDLRQKLLDGFVDIGKLNAEFDPLSTTILDEVTAHPQFKFLTDPQFTPSNWRYVFDNYDMNEMYSMFVAYSPMRAFNLNDFSLMAKEDALTFEDVLNHELQSQVGRGLIGTDIAYKDSVNIYLLDKMFDLYSTQSDTLKQYSLERL